MMRKISCLLFLMLALVFGCQSEPPAQEPSQVAPTKRAAVELTMVVVDDPPLAAGIKLLRGEWSERSGGQLKIDDWTTEQLLAAKSLSTDLIIYPSRHLGTLVERGWLRTVRDSVLQSEDVSLEDMYPIIRNAVLRYDNQVYSLSLGEPPLMLAFAGSADELGKITWPEISNPAAKDDAQLKFPHAVALLVRSLAYAQHRSGESAWFDVETMQPRLTEPPFVKALQEMIASEQPSTREQIAGTFNWPRAQSAESLSYLPLPAAAEVYSHSRQLWEANDSTKPIAFLGFAGRSVSVTRATRNSSSAFKLLTWLMSDAVATQVSSKSKATVWFRKSQLAQAGKWSADQQSAAEVAQLLSSGSYYLLPRIPAVDEYLQMLDEAVVTAIADNQPPAETLANVVQRWNTLTDRYNRDRQRAAYRKHLGFDNQ